MATLEAVEHQGFAIYSDEIFTDENLADSRPLFRTFRDLGDVVWVPSIDMFVVARYDDIVTALRAPDKLISGEGVTINEELNAQAAMVTTCLLADGDRHRALKNLAMKPFRPSALGELKERIFKLADDRVAMLATGERFEAMGLLASYLPLTIITEMVGIQGVDNQRMLEWTSALFDGFVPTKYARCDGRGEIIADFRSFIHDLKPEDLVPGGWADMLLKNAAEKDEITPSEAFALAFDYLVPALDTTIYSTGEMLHRLATVPGAWDKLRANPELIPGIVDESVRMATPLRGFSRLVVEDFQLSESVLPAGSRVWLMYGAGNLDERKYPNPEDFDVERNPKDHLGWGHGVHICLGKNLARIEMESILHALLKNVSRLEGDTPKRELNNQAQGNSELMMRMTPV